MPIVQMTRQLSRLARDPPTSPTTRLPARVERVAQLLAAEQLDRAAIARACGVSRATIGRVARNVIVRARVAHLRDQLRDQALDDEPLADKRNRVVLAGALARTLHREGEANGWRDTIAVTKAGLPITGLDWRRTDQVRQLLDYIAREVGDRTVPASSSTTNVGVSISMEDAAVRVAALFSRMPDVIEGEAEEVKGDGSSQGGREGLPPDNTR